MEVTNIYNEILILLRSDEVQETEFLEKLFLHDSNEYPALITFVNETDDWEKNLNFC